MSIVCDKEVRSSSDAIDQEAAADAAVERRYPTKSDVIAVIPAECFERSLIKSSLYLVSSLVLTIGSGVLAAMYIPLTWAWLPAWIAYAIFAGTAGTGCWVIAHECGHRAFTKYNWLQDLIGFVLHSALLVPYFSWQRSHAIHHARTNHLDLGETFVPLRDTTAPGKTWIWWQKNMGDEAFAVFVMVSRFLVGWPV